MTQLALGGSRLEAIAARAAERAALGGFNMASARATLTQMLSAIGRGGEFATYTLHDVTHIDALLHTADSLIPPATAEHLTTADALLLTLSIYFHDLGMLVTKTEFESREDSDFQGFRDDILSDKSARGLEFRARLDALDKADQEKFLYEEFVRTHHAERVERWIRGSSFKHLGQSDEAVELVQKIIEPLSKAFRNDIAVVARSHHLSDLQDRAKYKLTRAYGKDNDDVANVQYAAIMLRTVDLLHVTNDRTPGVQYRLASPTDPLGQREWKKQQAVMAVRPKDAEPGKSPEVVEIHARFDDPEGFFALMEYLDYCEFELEQTHKWAEESRHESTRVDAYRFPWVGIDRSNIETEGFDPRQLSFNFDHTAVLKLLTGHTLYNDSTVAVRELVQNSLDAVRLARSLAPTEDKGTEVEVCYSPQKRELVIRDRGVGMTKETIESFFLKVGASRYQSEKFQADYPDFVPISRFGIGVLSAFMIADEVRVATKVVDESVGQEMVLRSVHGRYLIREFDEDSDAFARIGSHGTEIALTLRASSGAVDMQQILEKWIVLPGSRVNLSVDGNEPVAIGGETVTGWLQQRMEGLDLGDTSVLTYSVEGFDIALIRRWDSEYKEWELLVVDDVQYEDDPFEERSEPRADARKLRELSGVCVQGVRVTSEPAAFEKSERAPVILVNAYGPNAPTTNVARSDLEAGPAYDQLIQHVYDAIISHIMGQIPNIAERVSQRFALAEAAYLFRQVFGPSLTDITNSTSLLESLRAARLFPTEVDGKLAPISCEDLKTSGFWTLVGPAVEDAGHFLQWAPTPPGLLPLLRSGGLLSSDFVNDKPFLADAGALQYYNRLLWRTFEPVKLQTLEGQSSLSIDFAHQDGVWDVETRYYKALGNARRIVANGISSATSDYEVHRFNRGVTYLYFPSAEDKIQWMLEAEFDSVALNGRMYFGPSSVAAEAFIEIVSRFGSDRTNHAIALELATLFRILEVCYEEPLVRKEIRQGFAAWLSSDGNLDWPSRRAQMEILEIAEPRRRWSQYSVWQRRREER